MTPEGKVKAAVKKLLKQYPNVYSHWPVQTGYGAPTLDCVGSIASSLYPGLGVSFAIETKAPGQHPTPRQELTMQNMRAGGVKVFVIGEAQDVAGNFTGMIELERWLDRHCTRASR